MDCCDTRLESIIADHLHYFCKFETLLSGSICPFPILPTPGQVCSLPGALDCHYGNFTDLSMNCCCGRCDVDMTCALDPATGTGVWQKMYSPLCPSEGCGSQGGFQAKKQTAKLTHCLPLGVITSPNYPGNYPRDLDKTDILKVESDKVLRLNFTYFWVNWGASSCDQDFVQITDGNGAILLERTCGQNVYTTIAHIVLPVIETITNTANISFFTSSRTPDRGWSLSWSAVTPGLKDFLANASLPSSCAKKFSQWG